jgi:hypothetical protein
VRTTIVTMMLALVVLARPAHAEDRCWDGRVQLFTLCEHLDSADALVPGKECWHADYKSFDTCRIESFQFGYRHEKTPREKCEEEGRSLDWHTGRCMIR